MVASARATRLANSKAYCFLGEDEKLEIGLPLKKRIRDTTTITITVRPTIRRALCSTGSAI
jgi:hypothetical protein